MRIDFNLIVAGAILLLSFSCAREVPEHIGKYNYVFEGKSAETRISIGGRTDGYYPCLWEEGDELSAFKVTGGASVGTASLCSSAGERYARFTLSTEEAPGTKVRLVYSGSSSYSGGKLPSTQQNLNGVYSLLGLSHAYSGPLDLTKDGTISFGLTHSMAIVRVEYSCKDLPAEATLVSASLKCAGVPLAGDYYVNYDEGSVNPGESTRDQVTVSFGSQNPVLSSSTSSLWMVCFPSEEIRTYHLVLRYNCGGNDYSVDMVFKTSLPGNTVNVLNGKNFSVKEALRICKIHVIGDSTAATNGNLSGTSYRGWGQILQYYFDPSMALVQNWAKGGASTKTFRSLGYWDTAKDGMRSGDYLLIQFGHNDENVSDGRGTTPQEYHDNIVAYINEAKAIGVHPVLLTPILRRRFFNGLVQDDVGDNWTHLKYAPKVHQIADSLSLPLVDVLEMTRSWLNDMGDELSKNYYLWFPAGVYSGSPDGKSDNTHLNQKGAFDVAGMVAKGLGQKVDSLTVRLRTPEYSEVEADLGKIHINDEEYNYGSAGKMDGNIIGREYEKPEKGPRPDTLGFEVYTYAPEVEKSTRYSVLVEGHEARVIPTTYFTEGDYEIPADGQPALSDDPQVCVFSAGRTVDVTVKFLGGAPSSVEVRPLSKNYSYTLNGDELRISLKAYDRISVEVDGDLLHPLFIFVNPNEVDEYFDAIDDPETRVLEAGKVHGMSLDLAGYKRLFIRGGAVVRNCFSYQYASRDVSVSGGGIIDSRTASSYGFDLHYSENASLSNFTVINKKSWTIRLAGCNNVLVDNVKSVGACPFNDNWDENDAFHFVACRNVTVKRCFGYSWDDAFVLNSSYVAGTNIRFTQDTYNHLFEDCIAWNVRPGNSFEIGFSNLSAVHDIRYSNCYSIHSGTKLKGNRRSGFSIHDAQKGEIYDIHYENVHVEDPAECGLTLAILKGSEYDLYPWKAGSIHDITYKNVDIRKVPKWGLTLQGYDSSHQLYNISFENLTIAGNKIMSVTDPSVVSSQYPAKFYNNISFK